MHFVGFIIRIRTVLLVDLGTVVWQSCSSSEGNRIVSEEKEQY